VFAAKHFVLCQPLQPTPESARAADHPQAQAKSGAVGVNSLRLALAAYPISKQIGLVGAVVDLWRGSTLLSEKNLEFGVFQFRLFQDGNVGVGVFPQRQEIQIRCAGFGGVALKGHRRDRGRRVPPPQDRCAIETMGVAPSQKVSSK